MKSKRRKDTGTCANLPQSFGGVIRRPHHLPMMALVVLGLIALIGIVSADNYWNGTPLETNLSGTVNGGVDVLFADTWSTSNLATDNAWANFTLAVTPSQCINITFARLYVVVYSGNMTEKYVGNETVTLYKDGASPVTLADHQTLALDYDRLTGTNHSYPGGYFRELNRVTSDYLSIFDVTDSISSNKINVSVMTMNTTPEFDGRIIEVKLVYGWNTTCCSWNCCCVNSSNVTRYWINEGHDPVTADLVNPYTANTTTFASVVLPDAFKAFLWVDFLDTTPGNGTYTWNGADISTGSSYPPTTTSGSYAGLNTWSWTDADNPGLMNGNNVLSYYRSGNYYKAILSVLIVKPKTICIYDFSGYFCGKPNTNEWAYEGNVTSLPPGVNTVPTTDITTEPELRFTDKWLEQYDATAGYAAQRFVFHICPNPRTVISLTGTWIGKGWHDDPSKHGANLYIWNVATGQYELLDSTTSGAIQLLGGVRYYPEVVNYIDADNNVVLLAEQANPSAGGQQSHIATDFVRLDVVDP